MESTESSEITKVMESTDSSESKNTITSNENKDTKINEKSKEDNIYLKISKKMQFLKKKKKVVGKDFQLIHFHFDSNYQKKCTQTKDKVTINEIMTMLKETETKGCIDYLINLITEKYINESIFYIPQIIQLLITKSGSKSLQSFLLDRCINQIKFSVMINWIVSSAIEDYRTFNKNNNRLEKLDNDIEMTLVNGNRVTLSPFYSHYQKLKYSQEEILKQSLFKEKRLEYYNHILRFYESLKQMCIQLKEWPKEGPNGCNRNGKMRGTLKLLNINIRNFYEQTFKERHDIDYNIKFSSRGVLLPFITDSEFVDDEYNNVIVKMLPEYSFCFSTKARVPVKVVCECVRVYECKDWDKLYIKSEDNVYSKFNKDEGLDVIICSNLNRKETKYDSQNDSIPSPNLSQQSSNNDIINNLNSNNNNSNSKINNDFSNEEDNIYSNHLGEEHTSNRRHTERSNRKIIEYSSLEDFCKIIDEKDMNIKRKKLEKKNEEEINKILQNVKYANEHPEAEKEFQKGKRIKTDLSSSQLPSRRAPTYNIDTRTSFPFLSYKLDSKEDFLFDQDLPLKDNPFGKKWCEIMKEIKEKSPFRNFSTYSIKTFIAKANDDLRQEVMTMQLIQEFNKIFLESHLKLFLRPYEIFITSKSSGLVEFLPNTISIDGLKKKIINTSNSTLDSFFRFFFSENYEEAQKNFAESLAAYSLITYLINIKDRHNGNILLDMNGNIIHIDFGFVLGISPGNKNFEQAPFKLTSEYISILDGEDSYVFQYFKSSMTRGLIECRKHYKTFETIISSMANIDSDNSMPCFEGRNINDIIHDFKERFYLDKQEDEIMQIVDDLIKDSKNNWRTIQYDRFQKLTNGILP